MTEFTAPPRLQQTTMFLPDLEREAIALLREHEPTDGYNGGFSGGKDSCVIKELARRAGVKVEWHYSRALDPPELVKFIHQYHADVIFDKARVAVFQKIKTSGMPWRQARWCCRSLKEQAGKGLIKILGVRAAESPRRAALWIPWDGKALAPILYWSDDDVWSYIRETKIPYCNLYDEGFDRLGCVGCPLASQRIREKEFQRWPRYEAAWKSACYRSNWANSGKHFSGPDEFWRWWRFDQDTGLTPNPQCGEQELMRFQQ